MATTRSNLVAARIVEVKEGEEDPNGITVPCMFNPFEYTVSKTNSYRKKEGTIKLEHSDEGPQILKLSLIFDTYETGKDVSKTTRKLWKLMKPKEEKGDESKSEPPRVAFKWGSFFFVAVITNMSQTFTLFTKEGKPVRAKVDVTFKQCEDSGEDGQNPTSGGGPVQRVWSVVRGDRLDLIAAKVYGDATRWRRIADFNGITNPAALRPGQQLTIPHR